MWTLTPINSTLVCIRLLEEPAQLFRILLLLFHPVHDHHFLVLVRGLERVPEEEGGYDPNDCENDYQDVRDPEQAEPTVDVLD